MNKLVKLKLNLFKTARTESYSSTESGRKTNLVDYGDTYADVKTWEVNVQGLGKPFLLERHIPKDKDAPRLYALLPYNDKKSIDDSLPPLCYLALSDTEDNFSEIVALKTETSQRRKGLASTLLNLTARFENKNLVVHPDPMSDKSVTRKHIEKFYTNNGFQHVDKKDKEAPMVLFNYTEDPLLIKKNQKTGQMFYKHSSLSLYTKLAGLSEYANGGRIGFNPDTNAFERVSNSPSYKDTIPETYDQTFKREHPNSISLNTLTYPLTGSGYIGPALAGAAVGAIGGAAAYSIKKIKNFLFGKEDEEDDKGLISSMGIGAGIGAGISGTYKMFDSSKAPIESPVRISKNASYSSDEIINKILNDYSISDYEKRELIGMLKQTQMSGIPLDPSALYNAGFGALAGWIASKMLGFGSTGQAVSSALGAIAGFFGSSPSTEVKERGWSAY